MGSEIVRPDWASVTTAARGAETADEQFVLEFLAALSTKDADGLRGYFTEDATYQNMPLPPANGAEQVHALLGQLLSVISIDHIETFYLASRDGFVFTERVDRLTARSTGRTFDLPVAGVIQVRDAKVAAWRDYFDLRDFEEGTGLALRG